MILLTHANVNTRDLTTLTNIVDLWLASNERNENQRFADFLVHQVKSLRISIDSNLQDALVREIVAREVNLAEQQGTVFNLSAMEPSFSDFMDSIMTGLDEVIQSRPSEILAFIKIKDYSITKYISGGGYGQIFQVLNQSSVPFALKRIQAKEIAVNEFSNLLKLNGSERVISPISAFSIGDFWFIVLNYFEGKPLSDYVSNALDPCFSLQEKLRILVQVAEGIKDMHVAQLIHRDIKPENILVNSNMDAKIIDLGISVSISETADKSVFEVVKHALTEAYAAPEQMLGQKPMFQNDIYSFGVTAYELLCGSRPFGMPFRGLPYPTIRGIPGKLNKLLSQMLEYDVDSRLQSIDIILCELLEIQQSRSLQSMSTSRPLKKAVEAVLGIEEPRYSYREMVKQQLDKGVNLSTKFLYVFDGASYWIRNCQNPAYKFYKDSLITALKHFESLIDQAVDVSPGGLATVVSLGAGDGTKDRALLELIGSKNPEESLLYCPMDVSDQMLVEAMRVIKGYKAFQDDRIKVRAIIGDIASLPDYCPAFNNNGNKLFTILGNTIGNSSEEDFLSAISQAMSSKDLVLFEINIRNPRLPLDTPISKQEIGLPTSRDFELFRFSPLSALGIPFDSNKLKYKLTKGHSVVPGTVTSTCYYELAELDGVEYRDVNLSLIHHYDRTEFVKKLKDYSLEAIQFRVFEESVCLVLAIKE